MNYLTHSYSKKKADAEAPAGFFIAIRYTRTPGNTISESILEFPFTRELFKNSLPHRTFLHLFAEFVCGAGWVQRYVGIGEMLPFGHRPGYLGPARES